MAIFFCLSTEDRRGDRNVFLTVSPPFLDSIFVVIVIGDVALESLQE